MPHPLDMSSVARARRNARHHRQLRDLMLVSVRPRVFAFVFFASCALVTVGVIGKAAGWW